MILLNLRFQVDRKEGLLDVHAFVMDDESGGYMVYCRTDTNTTTVIVPTFALAVACLVRILKACDKEVISRLA